MSRRTAPIAAILEWSSAGVRAWTPGSTGVRDFASLSEASQSLGLRGKTIGLAISRRHAFLRSMSLPNTSKEEAMNILKLQLDQAFPLPPSELALDFCFVGDPSPEGRPAVVAAMKAETLRTLYSELSSLGIKAAWAAPASLGSQQLARARGFTDALVMEATEEGLAIDVIVGGALTASRSAGSRAGSIDIAAESVRTQAAHKLSNARVILAGGLAAGALGETIKESPLEALAELGGDLDLQLPERAALRERSKVNGRRQLALLLWAAVFAVGLLVYVERSEEADRVAQEKKSFERQKRSITQSSSKFTTGLARSSQNSIILANAFEPAQSVTDVVALATSRLPEKAWLSGVNYERGRRLQLKGTALNSDSVSDYVEALAATDRFRDVQLVFANNVKLEEVPVVQFSVTLHVIGNIPLDDKNLLKTTSRSSRSKS
jgi:Tfp pilus assembly protein PilN